MRKIIFILTILIPALQLHAQRECAFILEEAQDMFDAGLIETIPDKLAGCLESGFTYEEKLQAYKLVILSYLYDDNIEKADDFMLLFLSDYPDYEPVATDPREFILLMDTYDTDPVLLIGGSAGPGFAFPVLTGNYGVQNNSLHGSTFAPGGAGFQIGFEIRRNLTGGLDLYAGLKFVNNVYDSYLDDDAEVIVPSGEVTDFSVIDFYETQNRLHLPVGIEYRLSESDLQPYFSIGFSPGIMLTASGEALREYKNTGEIRRDPISVANVGLRDIRRFFNLWISGGAGLRYDFGPGILFLDLKYHFNAMNQLKPGSERYAVDKLVWEAYYVSDNFLLNSVALNAGVLFPIYRPKKKAQ
jgi:hypothetical protein